MTKHPGQTSAELTKERGKEITAELLEYPEGDPLGFEAFVIPTVRFGIFIARVRLYQDGK